MVGNLPDPAILRIPLGRSQKGSKNGTPRGLRLGAGPEIEGGVKAHRGGKSAWNSTDVRSSSKHSTGCISLMVKRKYREALEQARVPFLAGPRVS